MTQKYRKKPVVIEAIKWDGTNSDEIMKFSNATKTEDNRTFSTDDRVLVIRTLEGNMYANIGDWIIKGVHGEFYPCKPDIFEKTYEPVEGE